MATPVRLRRHALDSGSSRQVSPQSGRAGRSGVGYNRQMRVSHAVGWRRRGVTGAEFRSRRDVAGSHADRAVPVAVALLVVLAICIWFFRIQLQSPSGCGESGCSGRLCEHNCPDFFGSQIVWHVAGSITGSPAWSWRQAEHGTGSHRNWPRSIRWLCPIWLDTAKRTRRALSIGTILAALEEVLTYLHEVAEHDSDGNSLVHGSPCSMRANIPHEFHGCCSSTAALKFEQNEITLTPKNREEARRAFDAILDPASRVPAFVLDDLIRVTNTAHGTADGDRGGDVNYVLDGKLEDFPYCRHHLGHPTDCSYELRAHDGSTTASRAIDCNRALRHGPQLECP